MPEASVAGSGDSVVALLSSGGYRDLYYDWEQNQWEATAVDLVADAAAWDDLDPLLRRRVSDSVAWRALRARTAIAALVPFVDAAPEEEQQVTLTTQLADEARHLVFFERYAAEVLGRDRHESDTLGVDEPSPRLLHELFPDAAGRVDAGGGHALVSGVVVYHLGVLASVALPEGDGLRRVLRDRGALPGLVQGMDLEAAALARHVVFGLRFVGDSVAADPAAAGAARDAFDRVRPVALASLDALRGPVGSEEALGNGAIPEEREPAAWFQAAGVGFLLSA